MLLKEKAMKSMAIHPLIVENTMKIKGEDTKITTADAAHNIRERRKRMLIRKKADNHEIKKLFRRFVSLYC
jgi:hypothetical protein